MPKSSYTITAFLCIGLYAHANHAAAQQQAQPSNDLTAQWKQSTGTFRIGVSADSSNPRGPGQYERFRQLIAEALDMPVELFVATNIPALVDAQATRRVDYSIHTGLSYATTKALCDCVVPLVAPSTGKGATAIRSILLAASQTLPDIAGLASARLGVGPVDSLTGAIVPNTSFLWQGVALADAPLQKIDVSSAENGLDLLAGDAIDGVFGWEFTRPNSAQLFGDGFIARFETRSDRQTTVLWRSEPYLFGPHVVADNVPPDIVRQLRNLLLNIHAEHPLAFDEIAAGFDGPFHTIDPSEYRNYEALLK